VDSSQPVNPYIAGSPVTGTEMFFGRQDVFSFVKRNLIGQHRDTPVVLYGQRRTGKTSVLYQLQRNLDPRYRCVFIDLHGLNLNGTGNLLLGMASAISRGLRRDHRLTVEVPDRAVFLADPQSVFETSFLDAVWDALGEDRLVLMLDEVVRLDEEVKAGRLDHGIFEYLRHLMQHHPRLSFIFSLGSGLEELRKDYAYLFSVALYHRISFLEPGAARELITQPVAGHYQVAPAAVQKILAITSGHPYYTQLVCHCLFDRWTGAPKPVMEAADVDAVLAEAIELGSANLTYVWEDSLPEEQVLMAGMASAMPGRNKPVTFRRVQNAWREAGVSPPAAELASALRSLTAREILTGSRACAFTVDLQRRWLDKHRRLDWVKEELPRTVEQWPRTARATRRVGYLALAAAVLLVAGYLTAAGVARIFPFPAPGRGPTPQLLNLLPGDLRLNEQECQVTAPPGQWVMPGMVQALRCSDPGLTGGTVYAFQSDSSAHFQAGWRNFNTWWGFPATGAGKVCPPSGTARGIEVSSTNSFLPSDDNQAIECGPLRPGGGGTVPAFAFSYPLDFIFVVAEGGPGSSFATLVDWLNQPAQPAQVAAASGVAAPAPLATLTQLLPHDVTDPATQCSAHPPPFAAPGLVQGLACNDPGLPGGGVTAYQLNSFAAYQAAWAAFNTWWGFMSADGGTACPPDKSGLGTAPWTSSSFPTRVGQVLECQYAGAGTAQAEPAYAWTYPTENAFIVAQGGPDSTFGTLSNWWMRDMSSRSTLTVTAVSPSTGPAAGGTTVTITGTGLAHATRVSFGGAAARIVSDSDTRITATAPPGSGTVDVTVTTAGGTSEVVFADLYTYS